MILTENELTELITNIIKEYVGDPRHQRYGDLGGRTSGEGYIKGVQQTNDLDIKDLGIASPEKREQWKKMGRKNNASYYPNGNPLHLSAHMRHLKSLYGNRIEFFSYNNGNNIFYKLDGKIGYLTPNNPESEYK